MNLTDSGNRQESTGAPVERPRLTKGPVRITGYHLSVAALIAASLLLGAALPFLPTMVSLMLIAVIPAIIASILILRNPFIGVYL